LNRIYEKKENETDYEYGLRLIKIKNEQKPDDLEWADIVELLHLDIHRDTFRKAAGSGTPYSGYSVMKYYEEKHKAETAYQLEQLKIQMRDRQNDLNRKLRDVARTDNMIKLFKQIIKEEVQPLFNYVPQESYSNNTDMVIMVSDVHYGINNDNFFNKYSPEIAEDRLMKYLNEIIETQGIHHSENCYLFLGGDLISGAIHNSIRIENAENVIMQLRQVSILLSHFTNELSKHFNKVEVYHCPGNHSRLFQKKEDNQKGEYLDSLIPFYMQAALQNLQNVIVHVDNIYDDELCTFEVRGHLIAGVHGHKDTPGNVLNNITKLIRQIPDLILMGHRHANGLTTIDKTKVIECGSLSGMDSYCIDNRLVGSPEQVVLIISEKKLITAYSDIQL